MTSPDRSEAREYEGSEALRIVTVDSRMADVLANERAAAVFDGVIRKWLPGAAEQVAAGLRGQDEVTPRQVAGMLPAGDRVVTDLERGFAAVSTGEQVPTDLFVVEAASADAALEADAALLSGEDFWLTRAGDGIRALVMIDGPHGVRLQRSAADHLGVNSSEPATCFPPATGLGSSWDPELAATVAQAIGREAREQGADVLLGPGVNIKRSPLGGRNFEYLSEDPVLSGGLGAAWVEGLQSTGVGASLKHFVANNQETDRMRVSSEMDARTLREIYLPAFEHIVKTADPATVMSAYNALNGVFASENRWLLTDLLRDEWGFNGLVVSDWGAIKDRVVALHAGTDLEMPSSGDQGTKEIVAAVREGRLDPQDVSVAVERLRRLSDRTTPPTASAPSVDYDAHHTLARRAGRESAVLLRNEDSTLPLRTGQKVAVLGSLAVDPQFQGGGSSHVNPTRVDIPLEELRALHGAENVVYASGYDRAAPDSSALLDEASAVAASSDVAVVFVGLYEADQTEGFDRTDLELPREHVALIQRVAATAPRTVVVLMNGGVVSLEPWHDQVDAILEGWALGQSMGGALADVLTGVVSPSGRLAETIPMTLSDTPSFLTFPGENGVSRYGEGIFVGYRYYTSANRPVRYSFGHGLSYTEFALEDATIRKTAEHAAVLEVRVRNVGERPGAEVVQVYVASPQSPVRRPTRHLVGFNKVHLEPGESAVVQIALDRRAFAYWDVTQDDWTVSSGTYRVQIGRSAEDIVTDLPLELDGDPDRVRVLSKESSVKDWFAHPVVGPALIAGIAETMGADHQQDLDQGLEMMKLVELMPMAQFARMPMVGLGDEVLDHFVSMSVDAARSATR
jgi:beta-glucosidase-like glycosyl hydrolase